MSTLAPRKSYAFSAKKGSTKPKAKVGGVKQSRLASVPKSLNRSAIKSRVDMADCSKHYLASLLDPENVPGACLPYSFPVPSRKEHLWASGTIITGATLGGIVCRMKMANDITAVLSTTTAYAGGGLPTAVGATVLGYSINSAYADAAIGDTSPVLAQYRIVSACLKIRYTGREDAMSGSMTWLEQADHQSLVGLSDGNLKANINAVSTRVTKDWQQINYSGPVSPGETEFVGDVGNAITDNYFLGCLINNGVSAEPLSFEFEFHVNVEWIGQQVPGKTPSHSDLNGFAKIQSAIKSATLDDPLMPNEIPRVLSQVYNEYQSSGLKGVASKYALSALFEGTKYASPMILAAMSR